MAAKHRKSSRPAAVLAAVVAPGGLAAAAVAATSLSTAVMTGTTTAVAPSVDLLALITPANSTAQIFAGTTYYGTDWTTVYGSQQVVPFLAGPQGIADAIAQHAGDTSPTGVTASGWGAGQTGTALGILANNNKNDLKNVGLVILDNNTNRAGGGFWTTYGLFAPLLLTSAEPTPNNTGVPVLDVAYEYNINSDAAVDPLNPFALGNSLAAYVFDYGAESTALAVSRQANGDLTLPDENNQPVVLKPGTHYVVENGKIVDQYPAPGTATNPNTSTIFVTVKSENLPLTRVLRLLPGGDIVADALDPTLTELVNAGYADGKGVVGEEAIPKDPGVPRPMQPGSSLGALGGVPGSVQDGLAAGVGTARDDISNPGNFVTKPLGEFGKLPFISTLPTSLTNSTLAKNNVNTTGAKPLLPGLNKPTGTTSSSDHPRPLKKVVDSIKSSLNKLAGGAHETADPEAKAP